ncbi:MAG: flippase-like domain-containing protein [Phycisphaerae bacterium]|nr:flippase-like domain-containing protein [Phycisphaerae bacterium]
MEASASKGHRHKWWWAAKILLAVLLCWLVLRKTQLSELVSLAKEAYASGSVWLGVALIPLAVVLAAWRWQKLLKTGEINLPYTKALLLTAVGNFFNHALPSLIGGDVVKAYYVMRWQPQHKSQTVISLIADRMAGLGGLAIICLAAIALGWGGPVAAEIRWPMFLVVGLLALAAVVLFVPGLARGLRLSWLIERLPFQKLLGKLRQAVRLYSDQPGALVQALAVSVLIHWILLSCVYLGGRALAPEAAYHSYLVLIPAIWMISSVPITPGAVAWMEWWYQMFFARVGVSATAALSLSLFNRFLWLLWAVPGLIIYIKGPGLPAAEQYSIEQVEEMLEEQAQGSTDERNRR